MSTLTAMEAAASTVCDIIDSLDRAGGEPAIVEVTAGDPLRHTRAELGARVRELARGLRAAGIGRGKVAALLAENRLEWIVAALAVIRSGATVLPIDTQMPQVNLRHILEDSGCALVFCNGEQAERLRGLELAATPRLLRLDLEEGEDSWRALQAGGEGEAAAVDPQDYAILFYTSGTTGPPKGVPLTHANLVFQLAEIEQTGMVNRSDRLLLPLPMHHVYPFVIGMLAPLYLQLPIILPKSLTGPEILRAIREGAVTAILGVPRLYRALYTGIETQVAQKGLGARLYFHAALGLSVFLRRMGIGAGRRLLAPLHRQFGPDLRLLASGGSALNPDLARRLEGLGWEIGIGYGLTETSPLLTLNLPGSGVLESVGRALPGVEIRIVPARDLPEQSEDGADSGAGEVLVRGPNVFGGYWKLPDKTREVLTDDGWFRTGDLGRLDAQGNLHLQGRASTVIVTESGKNIQPDEVEEHYAAHPFIAELGLLGDDGLLVGVLIPDAAEIRRSGLDEAEALKRAVNEQSRKLPSYQRLARYEVSREALPRTRLGKIRRHKLVERYRQARSEDPGAAPRTGPIDPDDMSDQDRELIQVNEARQVWDWLAQRYPDVRLTPDTSPYLDLNIDSIEMINLTLEISRLTGVELSEKSLTRVETVRDLLNEVVHQAEEEGGGLHPERILAEPEPYLADTQKRWLRPLGPVAALLTRGGRAVLRGLLRLVLRLRVEGVDNLPRGEAFVLTPNHVSYLDAPVLFAALPWPLLRRTFFAGWTGMVFKNAPLRLVARLGQTIPVDPRHAAASSLALGATLLKRGDNLIWFAEGERSRDGRLKPFKPGIGLLLKHYRVKAVPVRIEGAYEALPRGSSRLRRHPVTVVFGPAVDPQTLLDPHSGEEAQDQISSGLHDRVAALEAPEREA